MSRLNLDENNSRAVLLKTLAEADGKTVPSAALTERLNSSRQAVFKLVQSLRGEGLNIISEPQKGYRLADWKDTDALSPTLIEFLLAENPIFHSCVFLKETPSTQTVAKKLAAQDAPQGIIAVTDSQTSGRGRRGRSWLAPAGKNLSFSALLRPALKPGDVQLLNLAAGIAVRRAIDSLYNIKTELKWPNDVLVNGRKICGILSEAAGEPDRVYYAVTGIGVNVNLAATDVGEDIKDVATSLLIETGRTTPRAKLLVRILDVFAPLIAGLNGPNGPAELIRMYKEGCDTIGKEVRVVQDDAEFRGRAVGVTEQGAIIVAVDGEEKIFGAADVHHLRRI